MDCTSDQRPASLNEMTMRDETFLIHRQERSRLYIRTGRYREKVQYAPYIFTDIVLCLQEYITVRSRRKTTFG